MKVRIEQAGEEDAQALIAVQNLAFFADYQRYGWCPGYGRSAKSMRESMQRADVYKILSDGVLVGAVVVVQKGADDYFLGSLCVVPDYENRGIGQLAMSFLDRAYPNARHWSLQTPADKPRNHRFYQKCGYQITQEYLGGEVPMTLFEKYGD